MAVESVHEVEFRDIPGWPGYRVSRDGTRVQSCKRTGYGNTLTDTWKDMKIRDDATRGYKCLGLKSSDRRTWIPVHVLVLTAWVGPRPDGMFACHNNGNRIDNRLENLRWDTQKENVNDSIKHGTWTHGERYGGAKLTDEKVTRMYEMIMSGSSVKEAAGKLDVSKSALFNVIYGRGWKHVPRPPQFDQVYRRNGKQLSGAETAPQ